MTELIIRVEQSMRIDCNSDPVNVNKKCKIIDNVILFCRLVATIIIITVLSITVYQDRSVKAHGNVSLIEARHDLL